MLSQIKDLQLNRSRIIIILNITQSLKAKLYNIKPVMCDLWRSRRNGYNNITVTFLL